MNLSQNLNDSENAAFSAQRIFSRLFCLNTVFKSEYECIITWFFPVLGLFNHG